MQILGFGFALVMFLLIGLHMTIRPGAILRMFEKMAAESKDPLSSFNRATFDPSRGTDNAQTIRIIGVMFVVVSVIMGLMVFILRAGA